MKKWRNLTVRYAFHGEFDRVLVVRRRRDGVAAFGLVSVLRGQPDIDVLTRPVAGPARDAERDRLDVWRLGLNRRDCGELPVNRSHSVSRVALFEPRVAAVVIAKRLPEPGLILVDEAQATDPLRALPEVEVGHDEARRTAVF